MSKKGYPTELIIFEQHAVRASKLRPRRKQRRMPLRIYFVNGAVLPVRNIGGSVVRDNYAVQEQSARRSQRWRQSSRRYKRICDGDVANRRAGEAVEDAEGIHIGHVQLVAIKGQAFRSVKRDPVDSILDPPELEDVTLRTHAGDEPLVQKHRRPAYIG